MRQVPAVIVSARITKSPVAPATIHRGTPAVLVRMANNLLGVRRMATLPGIQPYTL